MPKLLLKLFTLMRRLEMGVGNLQAISKFLELNKNAIYKEISQLTKSQELTLTEKFGDRIVNQAKKSTKKTGRPIPYTSVNSSWIAGIAWRPYLNELTLKVKTGKGKTYILPFFPERVARAILVNKSPGRTLWNGYWRVVGKGSVPHKFKNLKKVTVKKAQTKIINKFVPKTKVPTLNGNKRLVLRARTKTFNTPKTGAKGITIKQIWPKVNRKR